MTVPPQGPLSALAVPIAEAHREWRALSPAQQNLDRAARGAAVLAWCGYIAMGFSRTLLDFPAGVLAGYCGLAGLGLLWFTVGLRGARGAPDIMAAVWSAALAGGWAYLYWHDVCPPSWGDGARFLLEGFYLAFFVARIVRFWIALRDVAGGGARRMVTRHIGQHAAVFRPARRRRFFFF